MMTATITSEVIVMATAPTHRAPHFISVEGLVDWIETVDADTFQDGRFRNCLLAARNRGEIFIPFFDDPSIRLTQIELLPHHDSRGGFMHSDNMYLFFEFTTSFSSIHVSTSIVSPSLARIYESEGVGGYFRSSRPTIYGTYQIREGTATVRDSRTGNFVERTISYVFNDEIGSTAQRAAIIFIQDGAMVRTGYTSAGVSRHFNNLVLDRATITYRPQDRPSANTITRTLRFTVGTTTYTIDGIPHTLDVAPFIDPATNRVMVPLRAVSEGLGARVDWMTVGHGAEVTITARAQRHVLHIHEPPDGRFGVPALGDPLQNGLGTPMLINQRVFVPLRFAAELLDATPRWDAANSAVYIYQEIVVD